MANYMAIRVKKHIDRVKKHIEHERTIFTGHTELLGQSE